MLCKVIVCDERFALSWSRLLGGEASNSKKTGLGDWARSRARRARPSSPPPGRLQYDTEMLEGVSFSRPVRGCAAELSVSPGETKLDFFFCAAPGHFRREVSFRSPTAAEDVRFLASIKTSAFS